MKAIVLGFGKSGKAAAELLLMKGYEVSVIDRDAKTFENCSFKTKKLSFFLESDFIELSEKEKSRLFDYSFIEFLIISSGINAEHKVCSIAKENNIPIISEADLAFRYIKNKTLAVTGTNGKTTTTMLVEFVLNQNNIKAVSLGNIGTSLSSYVIDRMKKKEEDLNEVLVVELSSFQIENMNGKYFEAAAVINITPDHLIWHGSLENYIRAKLKVKDCLKSPKNNFFISKQIRDEFFSYLKGDFEVFDEKDPFSDIEDMQGDENLCAAFALLKKFGLDKKIFVDSYRKFKKPVHRIELVAKKDDIIFYNDSKSTNIYSTIYAVKNLKGPIILIAGGEEKKLDFRPWIDVFRGKVKYIYLIGRCAKRIKEELSMFDSEIVFTLDKAVEQAYKMAKKGDKILLSPGCSSYDQFRNFEHRGEEFKCLVRSIVREEK